MTSNPTFLCKNWDTVLASGLRLVKHVPAFGFTPQSAHDHAPAFAIACKLLDSVLNTAQNGALGSISRAKLLQGCQFHFCTGCGALWMYAVGHYLV